MKSGYREEAVAGRVIVAAMIILGAAGMTRALGEAPASRPRLAARTFSSKLQLAVWAQTEADGKPKRVGRTPATEPVEIPECITWGVEPAGDTSVAAAAQEVREQSIPGLRLKVATDADLVHLKDLQGLQALGLWHTRVTDRGLECLKDLKALESLDLSDTQITDAGLEQLKGLQGLQTLILWQTQVTDAGMVHLKDLKGLRSLNLWHTQVTDGGLVHLKDLKELRSLNLWETKITDTGLAHLKEMAGLRWLDIQDTQVTEAGLAALKKALPDCDIHH